jgi:hypothetical protein
MLQILTKNFWGLRKTRSGRHTKSCLKGRGEWGVGCGEKGETIDNLRVKNGFGVSQKQGSRLSG